MIKKIESKALKCFMADNFCFSSLKKVGFYPKEMKHTDYEGQSKLICRFFGFKSVYEYGSHEIRVHITYGSGETGLGCDRPFSINKKGVLEAEHFIKTIFTNQLHI